MKTFISLFNRMFLIAGLLIALTPCAVCHGPAMTGTSHCSMANMGNMKCCEQGSTHKSHSPFCKVMDQSSLQISGAHLNVADVPAVSFAGVLPSTLRTADVSPKVLFDTSPPKPLVLRI